MYGLPKTYVTCSYCVLFYVSLDVGIQEIQLLRICLQFAVSMSHTNLCTGVFLTLCITYTENYDLFCKAKKNC